MSDGLGKVSDGLGKVPDGLRKVSDGLGKVSDGLGKVSDRLGNMSELAEAEGRFLYFNSSSTATSLTLLGAVILLGVIFYLVYVGGLLAPVGGSQYNRFGQDYGGGGYGYQGQARYMPRH